MRLTKPARALTATTVAIAALAIAATTLAWTNAKAGSVARPPATPTAIATVDLPAILDGLEEKTRHENDLQAVIQESQAKLDDLTNRLKNIEADLEMINRNTPQWRQKFGEGLELQQQAEARKAVLTQTISLQRGDSLRELYLKIEAGITKIAEREGYDIVLLDDSKFPLPQSVADTNMERAILSKTVLYAHDSTDITQQVIDLLNNEYRAP
ncbi:MAG: OmpH family outer membrane protein [Phycisphaerales bacterium JB059]